MEGLAQMPAFQVLKGVSLCLATGIFGCLSGTPEIAQEPTHSDIPCYATPCFAPETSPALRNTGLPPWGAPTLLPGAEGKKVLVVGDSWGMATAAGISKVFAGKGQVTDAAKGGCGIRVQHRTGSVNCPNWEIDWPNLMDKVRPDAVLMSVQMDTMVQPIEPGGKPVTILDDEARRKFVTSLDKAIRILSRRRTPVYLLGWPGPYHPGSVTVAYSGILLEFSKKYPGVHHLDTHHQLCNDLNQCPKEISGIPVYGPSHLSKQSEARFGNWILNSMFHVEALHEK
ncbi:SGNH hydrolase domain-containing protein (plasmid) [Streptomyces sp. NBC_01136]|uniref:SGNH hydrolase domain-containing protein n=1 Tax=unclassified Streptomyces TaxID=2593676 RepID=UPI002F918117|nr:SGNH hydrolase domain-containing protein [Streptomyces sp. NBC_01136]